MDELTSAAGIAALAAGALAVLSLLVALSARRKVRRVQGAQRVVMGESGAEDVVAHARRMQMEVEGLAGRVDRSLAELRDADAELGRRLDGAVTHCAVIRYDAMGEMTGRQSSSVALLDGHHNGVILSSILHRDHARLYAKPVMGGRSELRLSPEEEEAVRVALAGGGG